MDIKSLIKRDIQRSNANYSYYNNILSDEYRYDQYRRELLEEQEEEKKKQIAEQEEQERLEYVAEKQRKEQPAQKQLSIDNKEFNLLDSIKNSPRFFSTFDSDGKLHTYYQTPTELEENRLKISNKAEDSRTPEENAYYLQLDPGYIERIKDLYDSSKTYREAQNYKLAFKFWSLFKSAITEGLNDPNVHDPGNSHIPTSQRENIAKGLTASNMELMKNNKYLDDAFASYIQKKNIVEVETDAGNIALNDERRLYLLRISDYNNIILDYLDLYDRYNQAIVQRAHGMDNIKGFESPENIRAQMQKKIEQAKALEDGVKEAYSYNLGSNYGNSISGNASRNLYNFSTGTKDGLPINQTVIQYLRLGINQLKPLMQKSLQTMQEDDKFFMRRADRNMAELRKWQTWHTPSASFLAREQAAQDNRLSNLDTYLASMPGVMGSSASFNGTQIAGTGLNYIGLALMMSSNPYTSGVGAALVGAGAGFNYASGIYENAAEVATNYKTGFIERLKKEGLYDKFLRDGKKQLKENNIDFKTDDEVVTQFMLKRWAPYNRRIREIAEQSLYGANNLFQNDMIATTADVVFDTSLSMFAPYGPLAKGAKHIPVPRTEALKRLYRMQGKNLQYDMLNNLTRESGVGTFISRGMSPIAGGMYKAGRTLLTPITSPINRALSPYISKFAKRLEDIVGFSKIIPSKLVTGEHIGGKLVDFAGRTLAKGFSESVEEGKQHEFGEKFASGEFAGAHHNIILAFIDDLSVGVNTGFLFLGHQLVSLEADQKLMAEMRGGFLGGLLNIPTMVETVRTGIGVVEDKKAIDVVYENLLAEKYKGRAAILNAENFARYITPKQYRRVMEVFDAYKDAMKHVSESGRDGFSDEDIENQRKEFLKVYRAATSKNMLGIAALRGIKAGTDKYRTFVALAHYINLEKSDRIEELNSVRDQWNSLLQQNSISNSQFENLEQIVNEGLQDSSLTDKQRDYLLELMDDLQSANPMLTGRGLINAMKTAIHLERLTNALMALYFALKQLVSEMEALKETSPEEYHKHSRKANIYKQELDSFLKKFNQRGVFDEYENGTLDISQIQSEEATDPVLFDQLSLLYRTKVIGSAQLEDLEYDWMNLLGGEVRSEDVFEENQMLQDSELQDILDRAHNNYKHQRRRLTKAEKVSRSRKSTEEMINRFKDSVDNDEQFVEDINRDFRETLESDRRRAERLTIPESTPQEEFNPFLQVKDNSRFIVEGFLNTVNEADRDSKRKELIGSEAVEGKSRALQAIDLYSEGAYVEENKDDVLPVYSQTGGTHNIVNIPIDKKFTHFATRPDGSRVYITKEQAEFIEYLNSLNDLAEQEVSQRFFKSKYISPTITSSYYEDSILEAILDDDKDRFDRLLQNIDGYVSDEKILFFKQLWEDNQKRLPLPGIVPIEGTRRVLHPNDKVRKAVRDAVNSCVSVITILGNYLHAIPLEEDMQKHIELFLGTLNESERKKAKLDLGKLKNGVTKLQQAEFYVNAGFRFATRKTARTVVYEAVAPTGETYRITKLQYEYASWLKYYKDRTDSVTLGREEYPEEANDKQKAVLKLLRKKLAYENPSIIRNDLRTGMDYFIVEDGKLVRYNRVHSQILPQFLKSPSWLEDKEQIIAKLRNVFLNKDEYKTAVLEYQDRFNNLLAERYGKDSEVYAQYKIDLSPYLLDDIITDEGAVNSIAHLCALGKLGGQYKLDIANRAVLGGKILDDICRDFFAGRTVTNKPEFGIPQDVFDKLILDLQKQKDLYESRGWVLSTEPYCWHAMMPNGTRVAGETDMIAVNKEGDIYIIDFKTSKYSFLLKQYKVVSPIGVSWENVIDEEDVPEGAETRVIPLALDQGEEEVKNKYKRWNARQITARQNYEEQQTFYANLIRFDLEGDVNVAGVELLVFLVKVKAGINPITEDYDLAIFDGFARLDEQTNTRDDVNSLVTADAILFQGSVQLDFSENINALWYEDKLLEQLKKTLKLCTDRYNSLYSRVVSLLSSNENKVPIKTKKEFDTLQTAIRQLAADSTNKRILADKNAIEALVDKINQEYSKLQLLHGLVVQDIMNYDLQNPPQQNSGSRRKLSTNRKEAIGLVYKFNCLDLFSEKWAGEELSRVSANQDFLNSAIFEIDVDSYEKGRVVQGRRVATPTVLVTIYYDEHLGDGSIKHHKFERVKLLFSKEDDSGVKYTFGLDGNNTSPLFAKIEAVISNPENKGKRIVLTNGSRTNGIVKYGLSQVPVQDAFNLSEEDMESCISGTEQGSVLGINKNGSVYYTKSARGTLSVLYGIDPDRALTDGLMSWYLNLNYDEDEGNREHCIPISLTPKQLTENDAAFIIDLLKNFTKRRTVVINGKEYPSPISNARLLRSIIRFGRGAEETGSDFIFDWAHTDERGFSTDNYTTVRIAKVGQYDKEINLLDDGNVKELMDILLNELYVYYNNEYAMHHSAATSRDASSNNPNAPLTNPFVGLEKFFKDHPELTQDGLDVVIEYSESLKFRRSDVDPELNGSYKGITGAHWMMKNGWMQTNFTGIRLPLISFEDVLVLQEDRVVPEIKLEAEVLPQDVERLAEEGSEVDWDDIGDNYEDGDLLLWKIQQKAPKKALNREQAEKRLKRILGNSFSIEFQDKAIDVFRGGWMVVAACKTDAIILTDLAGNDEEFHEAFHAVVDLLIGEKKRKALYNHYREHYGAGKNLTDTEVSEGLADMYYEFRRNTPIEWSWNIAKMFTQISNWVKLLYDLHDVKLATLFVKTNAGYFRNRTPDPESIAAFKTRNKNKNYQPYTVKDDNGKEVEFEHFTSFRLFNDAIKGIVYRITRDFGIDNLASNPENIKTDKKSLIAENSPFRKTYERLTAPNLQTTEQLDEAVASGKISSLQRDNVLRYRELFDKYDTTLKFILQEFEALGINSRLVRLKQNKQDAEGGSVVQDMVELGNGEFYTHSRSEDIESSVKYFLSTIPSVRWLTEEDIANGLLDKDGNPYTSIYRKNKKGEIIYDTNGKPVRITIAMNRNTLGEINFQDFQQVYQKLLKHLYNVKDIQDLINKLENLSDTDYVFYHVLKSLAAFRYRSYIRYNDANNKGIPKVMYKGKLLSPLEYIKNINNPTQDELYPKVVRYTHDIINDETGEVEHKAGDVIKGAVILVNADYESVTTQIFQAIKSQKLNFTFCYEQSIVDENGEIVAGKHKYNIGSTNVLSDTRAYPIMWFNYIRSATTGIFNFDENGEAAVNKESQNLKAFELSRKFLLKLLAAFAPNLRHKAVLDDSGRKYDIDNDEDFDKILTLFISALNNVGIGINKHALIYGLTSKYPTVSLLTSFEYIFQSNEDNSIRPFIQDGGVLDTLLKAIDSGNVELFTKDLDSKENKKKNIQAVRSGSYLYSMNGFVISMAYMLSDYKSASLEMMVLGPENTKMYTFALNHSASDTTYELNNVYDDDGNMTPGNIMEDLQNVSYITINRNGRRLGSVIAKAILDKQFNPNHNRIVLHTSSGLKTLSSREGGVKYADITEREDYINKVTVLRNSNIVFPTLSDKSTWFYLSGIKLPGLNWDAADNIEEFGALPVVGLRSGRLFLSNSDSIGSYAENPVLDQMLEYALCELANIEKTIDDLGLNADQEEASVVPLTDEKKVVNYHTKGKPDKKGNYKDSGMHGARFFFLTGVYDERDGSYIEFNKINKSDDDLGVIKCYELAKQYFFDKRINPQTGVLETDEELRARQRSLIMAILQRRLDEALEYLVKNGIIDVNESQTKYSNKNGKQQVDALPSYFRYVNKYLDASDINHLAEIYHALYKGKYDMRQCESLAIVAYIFDINNKSIMSMEETERIYTGMPQFFKCKYDSDGHLIDRGEDESKRYGGEGSTGSNNREDLPNIETEYTCAEIKDWEVKSSLSETLTEAFRLDEYRDALATRRADALKSRGEYTLDEEQLIYKEVYKMELEELRAEFTPEELSIIDAKIEAEARSFYGKINVADGTAYISDKMAENLLRQRGKYNKRVKEAFEYLRNIKKATITGEDEKEIPIEKRNGYLTSYKAYRIILQAMISTQKYVAFGFRMENGVPVHFFDKYALFPIFEGISYGFTRSLYEKMNDPENPVDMVMFESAVKSGGEGAQTFNPEMTKEEVTNFSFKDHIYKQKYKFLRRLLNTDPRLNEIMSMGTQAAKIALSTLKDGLEYTLKDGTTILGRELKDRIMDAQRVLSDRGVAKITKEFFKDNQEDIEAFAEFAKDELMSRDADKNILDALQIEEDPETHEKRFHLDLNAVSNMAWLESILCSYINKNVIDINLPGNAYYQRSVFGMEGPVIMTDDQLQNDMQGYVINDGKPLLMINEKGSMDALISIDYFLHLIPKDIRYDFAKARQFLIDNKIIGKDAEANTMAYRIPTQAVSSVHALRFIDVIPVVRDTIVLPREFTKITGSDFDIDKLYLSSYNYKLKNGKLTRDYDESSDEYLQNQLLSYYFTLLEDAGKQVTDGVISKSRYMHMLHRSIDNDTSLVDNVLEKIESTVMKLPYEPMRFGCLHTLVYIKSTFISGKKGIAPFALNNNSHIFTMLYNVSFAKADHGLLDVLGMRSLAKALDRDGNSILSWLSAMINIHVDAAKDPKSLKLNINEATYNLTNLLLRLGLGLDALYFLCQPVVRDLASVYQDANGSIVEDPGLSPTKRYEIAEARYIRGINIMSDKVNRMLAALVNRGLPKDERDNTVTESDVLKYRLLSEPIIRAIFSVDEDGKYYRQFDTDEGTIKGSSILEDIITNPEVLIDPSKPLSIDNLKDTPRYKIGDSLYSPKEIQAFVFMAKQQLDLYASALSELVLYTKIDTKKHGKNYREQSDYKKGYDRMHDAFRIARENNSVPLSMFDENLERMLDDSFIDRKTNNAISLLQRIMGRHMIHMTETFNDVVDYICTILNNKTRVTKNIVQRKLLVYIKQKCINQYMNDNNIDFRAMISGNATLSSRIEALKAKIVSDTTGKYSDFVTNGIITNTLLANIHPVPYVAQYGEELYSILTLDNVQSDDEARTNDYIDSWQQLLDSEDEEIRSIGNDLAIYAFMTSGDEVGFTKFFKYVPDSWRIASGYNENMRKMKSAFLSGSISINGDYNSLFNIDVDEFIRNNWQNHNIIPVMQAYTVRPKTRTEIEITGSAGNVYELNYIGHRFNYKDLNAGNMEVDKQADQIIAGVVVRNGKVKVTISMNPDTASFPPYIKMRRKNSSIHSADPYILYKLVATGIKIDNKGAMHEYPVYALTYPKGYSIRAMSLRFDFYEYERDDQYTHIFDPSVMVGDLYGDKLSEICAQIQLYVNRFGDMPVNLASVIDITELLEQEPDSQVASINSGYEQVLLDVYRSGLVLSSSSNFETGVLYPGMPEFNKLPAYTGTTMTYAGIGSRRTENAKDADFGRPVEEVMEEVASELEELGYTLNSGHADGSDKAFERGVKNDENKNIFTKNSATSRMYKIAREVHPNWNALGAYSKGLHARNTAQVFGLKLDTPVDFVLCYTPDGAEADIRTGATEHLTGYNRQGISNTGGTGQAISMASMKGIPVINMANPGWRQRLDEILSTVLPKQDTVQERKTAMSSQDAIDSANGFIGEVGSSPYIKVGNKYVLKQDGDFTQNALATITNRGHKLDKTLEGEPYVGKTSYNVGYEHGSAFVMSVTNRELYDEQWMATKILISRADSRLGKPLESLTISNIEQFISNGSEFFVDSRDKEVIEYLKSKGAKYTLYKDSSNPVVENTARVWAGKNPENADLSNMYPRSVLLNYSNINFANGIKQYKASTVEQAFLHAKFMYASLIYRKKDGTWDNSDRVLELMTMASNITNSKDAWEARRLGKSLNLTDKELAYWNKIKYDVMKWIMKESFKQNHNALLRLLSTEDVIFTHEDDNSEWRELFPQALMQIREELRQRQIPQFTRQQIQEGQLNKHKCKGE